MVHNINEIAGEISLELVPGFEILNKTLFLKIQNCNNITLNIKYPNIIKKDNQLEILCKNITGSKILIDYRIFGCTSVILFGISRTIDNNKLELKINPFTKFQISNYQIIVEINTVKEIFVERCNIPLSQFLNKKILKSNEMKDITIQFNTSDVNTINSIKILSRFMVIFYLNRIFYLQVLHLRCIIERIHKYII